MNSIVTGMRVLLRVPENPQLHGAEAIVSRLEDWGAHVYTKVAATGKFRALWSEMVPIAPDARAMSMARVQGYEGDSCPICGCLKMRRNGACLLCDGCGATSGCS